MQFFSVLFFTLECFRILNCVSCPGKLSKIIISITKGAWRRPGFHEWSIFWLSIEKNFELLFLLTRQMLRYCVAMWHSLCRNIAIFTQDILLWMLFYCGSCTNLATIILMRTILHYWTSGYAMAKNDFVHKWSEKWVAPSEVLLQLRALRNQREIARALISVP